jgi:glutaredoxin 3
MAARVRVFTTLICAYCVRAKMLLKAKGVAYEEIDVSRDHEMRDWLVKTTGQRTVPQIFINEESIGGFDELRALDRAGQLDAKLAQPAMSSTSPG